MKQHKCMVAVQFGQPHSRWCLYNRKLRTPVRMQDCREHDIHMELIDLRDLVKGMTQCTTLRQSRYNISRSPTASSWDFPWAVTFRNPPFLQSFLVTGMIKVYCHVTRCTFCRASDGLKFSFRERCCTEYRTKDLKHHMMLTWAFLFSKCSKAICDAQLALYAS